MKHELDVAVSTKRRHAVKSGGVRPAGKQRTGQPAWALAPGARLQGGGAAPRHWQTLTGKRRASGAPRSLQPAHMPLGPCPPALEPRPRPPLVFVQNRGDEDWIDSAEFTSVEFCRRAKPQSQRFGSTALGAAGQAAPSAPSQYRVAVSDTAVVPMHVSFVIMSAE